MNIQSFLKKKSLLELFLHKLSINRFYFDVLTYQETWLDKHIENLAVIEGYTTIYKHKSANKIGGGLAISVRSDIHFIRREDLEFKILNEDGADLLENLFIEVKDASLNKNILIGVLYRSPRFSSTQVIIKITHDLEPILRKLKYENKDVVLCGDINIDLMQSRFKECVDEYIDMMTSNGYIQQITLPTHISQTSSSLIDHIYKLFSSTKIIATGVMAPQVEPYHSPTFIILQKNTKIIKNDLITYRDMSDNKVDGFKHALEVHNWSNIISLCDQDIHIAYDSFINEITTIYNACFPLKQTKFNKYKHKGSQWITHAIINKIEKRDKLSRKILKSKPGQGKSKLMEEYKALRDSVSKDVREAKKSYYNRIFTEAGNNMKTMWSHINEVTKKPKESPLSVFAHNNSIDIANQFNNYFVNIGPEYAKKLLKPDLSQIL
jgi:hypothetical protein